MAISSKNYLSWGKSHCFEHHVTTPTFQDQACEAIHKIRNLETPILAYGCGRSYGDSCLNENGYLLDTRHLDRFISFDDKNGIIECEAGVTLAQILSLLEQQSAHGSSWFLPVTPGTKFVTVGGAIANDIHGKNHHNAGCFGNHILSLRLLRSDGKIYVCTPSENKDLFKSTIGGLGLTGLILSCSLKLKPVSNFWLETEDFRYNHLDDFFTLAESSIQDWEYTAAWIDCFARGKNLGRGIFTRAKHIDGVPELNIKAKTVLKPKYSLYIDLPQYTLNNFTISMFNALYWRKIPKKPLKRVQFFDPVFYPLDAINNWNRLYGKQGLFQYQCVIPEENAYKAIPKLLETIAYAQEGSFLAVLKTLGRKKSPGFLSFPLQGTTLALDFPNRGEKTLNLLNDLDQITLEASGRLYCAKDGRMSAFTFQKSYPNWTAFSQFIDPHFSSSFWRRVSKPYKKGVYL